MPTRSLKRARAEALDLKMQLKHFRWAGETQGKQSLMQSKTRQTVAPSDLLSNFSFVESQQHNQTDETSNKFCPSLKTCHYNIYSSDEDLGEQDTNASSSAGKDDQKAQVNHAPTTWSQGVLNLEHRLNDNIRKTKKTRLCSSKQ